MPSDRPIAKEASTNPVDLTTLNPAHAVLSYAASHSGSRPKRAQHDCGLDSATPPELSCRDCGASDRVFVSFHWQGPTERVARCMLALIGVAWVVILHRAVAHPCDGGGKILDTTWLHGGCMGGEEFSLWHIPRRRGVGEESVGPPNRKLNLLSPAACSQVPWTATALA